MYQRFTERARKVLQLANQEAQRFNHEYVGTEHLLLGLVREGALAQACRGVAATVLGHFGVDLRRVRREVEMIVQSGPEMVTMGRLPMTPRAKKAIEYAIEEARELNCSTFGTGALLVGLLREQEGVAFQVLMNFGLDLNDMRREVQRLLGRGPETPGAEAHPSWVAAHEPSAQDFPAELAREATALGARIHALNREKEAVISAQDFERAAHLRDQADRLVRQRQALLLEWLRRHRPDPSWLSCKGAVAQIAWAIYTERRWGDLLVLADALEEAGCADREILDHCRRPGEHGAGCWVIDLLLGGGVK